VVRPDVTIDEIDNVDVYPLLAQLFDVSPLSRAAAGWPAGRGRPGHPMIGPPPGGPRP
jgi:hypothetical protein